MTQGAGFEMLAAWEAFNIGSLNSGAVGFQGSAFDGNQYLSGSLREWRRSALHRAHSSDHAKPGSIVLLIMGNRISYFVIRAQPSSVFVGPVGPLEYSWSLYWIFRGDTPRMLAAFDVDPLHASNVRKMAYRSRS